MGDRDFEQREAEGSKKLETDVDRALLLARIPLALALAAPERLNFALDACARSDLLATGEVEETILQSIPYGGFPGAVEALGEWRRLRPASPQPTAPVDSSLEEARRRGESIFAAVYGGLSQKVRGELRARSPDLERWIIEFAYGRVMGRDLLKLADLEALGIASLLGQERRPPLHSHIRGAIRAGWSSADLAHLIERLSPWCSPEIVRFALRLIESEGGRAKGSHDDTIHEP